MFERSDKLSWKRRWVEAVFSNECGERKDIEVTVEGIALGWAMHGTVERQVASNSGVEVSRAEVDALTASVEPSLPVFSVHQHEGGAFVVAVVLRVFFRHAPEVTESQVAGTYSV